MIPRLEQPVTRLSPRKQSQSLFHRNGAVQDEKGVEGAVWDRSDPLDSALRFVTNLYMHRILALRMKALNTAQGAGIWFAKYEMQ